MSVIYIYGSNPTLNITLDCHEIFEKLKVIVMNQAQLLEALTGVQTTVSGVSTALNTVASRLTEAVTEILDKIDELKNFELSPEVTAVVDSLVTAVTTVTEETSTISTQAQTLADIVPNP